MTMQEQQEDRDSTAGQGQPRSEGSSVAPAGAPAASTSTAAPESTPSSPPQPQAQALPADDAEPGVATDDPEPDPKRTEMAKSVALAELMKPVAAATEDLYSTEPDKVKARAAIAEAYTKAYTELKAKYDAADTSFVRTAEDMAAKLDDWIDRLLEKPDGLVASALGHKQKPNNGQTALRTGLRQARGLPR
jgi:hypothetical protein